MCSYWGGPLCGVIDHRGQTLLASLSIPRSLDRPLPYDDALAICPARGINEFAREEKIAVALTPYDPLSKVMP